MMVTSGSFVISMRHLATSVLHHSDSLSKRERAPVTKQFTGLQINGRFGVDDLRVNV